MIPIIQEFIHINRFSRTGKKLRAKLGFVMHWTLSFGAPARNISRYFNNLKNQNPNDDIRDIYAGAHYSVDRFNIIQSIPTDELAHQCGSSKPYMPDALTMLGSYPNNSTIGIEMCVELDGSIHEDTFQNAADLVVHLIREEGFPNTIFTHHGVVGWKKCPLPWVTNPSEFERFKMTVNTKLEELRMIGELTKKLEELTANIEKLAERTAKLEKECEETVAPEWFANEFPNVDLTKVINSPLKTKEMWEILAITWRSIGYKG